MALSKRGTYWHFDFWYRGKRYQGSTDQTNIQKARLTEAKKRSDAALEYNGILPPKEAPLFQAFLDGRFLDHVRQHNKAKPRTVSFYEEKSRRLLEYPVFQNARLSEIDENAIAQYKDWRSKQKKQRNGAGTIADSSINRELATLRKALGLAEEWKLISKRPKVRRLPGEKGREFVLSGDLEKEYLQKCKYPLKESAILMLDLGLRPEETVCLAKSDVTREGVTVVSGKTKNARRFIDHTDRTREVWQFLCDLWPDSAWLFPGHKQGSHLQRSSLDHLHNDLRAENEAWPKEFVLYSLRHTFGTRYAESGANVFEITTTMGHSDIRVSQKYVHPSNQSVSRAMKRKELLDKMLRGEVHEEVPIERKT